MPANFVARNRQTHSRSNWRIAALFSLACLVGGCGESISESVRGKVTHKGQPVVEGEVTFFQPGSGRVAQSPLDSEGNYSLNLSQGGLPPGDYKIIVTPSTTYVEVDGPNGRDLEMVIKGEKSIPRQYRERKSTPLKATITGGSDSFNFELE